ncbi:hypothetical protein [Corynebacterium hindlerae]
MSMRTKGMGCGFDAGGIFSVWMDPLGTGGAGSRSAILIGAIT